MFHIVNPTTLYDVVHEKRIELSLLKGKKSFSVAQFLDDVSSWMDGHRDSISDDYLPFCALSVGIVPMQVSAFMYGLFVGKALEKHKLKVSSKTKKVDKETILKEIEKNLNYYNGIAGDSLNKKSREQNPNETQDNPGDECNK